MTQDTDTAENRFTKAAKDLGRDFIGVDEFRQSKIGYLTGATAIKQSVDVVTGAVKDSRSRLGIMAKAALGRDSGGVPVPKDFHGDEHAFFEASRLVNNKTHEDVDHSIDNTFKQFCLYGLLLAISVAWGTSVARSSDVPAPFSLMLGYSLSIPLAALTFRAAWTNWAFRNRTLNFPRFFAAGRDMLLKRAPKIQYHRVGDARVLAAPRSRQPQTRRKPA